MSCDHILDAIVDSSVDAVIDERTTQSNGGNIALCYHLEEQKSLVIEIGAFQVL